MIKVMKKWFNTKDLGFCKLQFQEFSCTCTMYKCCNSFDTPYLVTCTIENYQLYLGELHYFLGHPVVHINNFKEFVEQHFFYS